MVGSILKYAERAAPIPLPDKAKLNYILEKVQKTWRNASANINHDQDMSS